jgi:ribonucleotide reductase beta subunit family protein with ferritin-like domain
MYAQQNNMEGIHSESYSLMISNLIPSREKQSELFQAIKSNPSVQRLAKWAQKYMDREKYPFRVRLVAFILFEGFVFSGMFATIFWFKNKGLLKGITNANLFIARDESLHEDFGVLLYSKLLKKCEPQTIHDMTQEVYDIACDLFKEALSDDMVGMNYSMMRDYLKINANRIVHRLQCDPLFDVTNIQGSNMIVDYMSTIGADVKVSFFEERNHVYLHGVHEELPVNENDDSFVFDEDF